MGRWRLSMHGQGTSVLKLTALKRAVDPFRLAPPEALSLDIQRARACHLLQAISAPVTSECTVLYPAASKGRLSSSTLALESSLMVPECSAP
jgi:hypothetical protein